MSMLPFFPSLRPPIANRIWFDSASSNEEEVLKYERELHSWLDAMKNVAVDIHPLGKALSKPGLETDDEDANDDSDDSDSHDDEDDDTNDRAILPERSALGLHSPGEEMNLNDDVPVIVGGGSQ